MPRIRTLKPEHRQHRKIGPLSDRAYRLWAGCLCEADDHGRLVAEIDQLRVLIWGYHPKVTAKNVADALKHLTAVGLLKLYTIDGVQYAYFPSWNDHQRVDHPAKSRLPDPNLATPREVSRGLANLPGGSEGIGKDRIGEDRIGKEGSKGGKPDRLLSQPESNGNNERSLALCGISGHISGCRCPAAEKARKR